ncbi:hypothetical protein ACROYT_G024094 [Oculina patagonica]
MKKSKSNSKRSTHTPDPRLIFEVQSVLRGRIFHGDIPPVQHGLEEQKRELLDLIKRCVQYGENNSVLLIGPRGSGKSLLVKTILEDLSKTKGVKQNMLEVNLNGLVQTDDRAALLEITRQLQLENTVGDKVFGSFAENLAFLLDSLKSGGQESQSILFILDEFDLFTNHKNQLLLYNLFDVSQSAQTPICVIGLTCRLDVVELLEKRVKSRFSHRQIHLFNSETFEDYLQVVRSILTLPSNFKDRQFAQAWSSHITDLLEDKEALAVLKSQFSITKDVRSLHRLLAFPVCSLSQDHLFIEPKDLVDAQTKLGVDCKAAMLCGISVLELCLIIAMKHLITIYDGEPFNFEMVYKEYQKFAQKKGFTVQSFEKPVVLKAFEHLTALEFVKSIDSIAKNTPKEYRLVTLLVDPMQINDALQRYPDCPTEVKQWAMSAIV